jgi:HPt (histidine-containing phosphotransfer) domain-containing protein
MDSAPASSGVQGDEPPYRRLRDRFRDRHMEFAARFEAAHEAGDMATARRLAHELKSEAGSLGASALHEAAEALEDACTNGAGWVLIDTLLVDVVQHLDALIADSGPLPAGSAKVGRTHTD